MRKPKLEDPAQSKRFMEAAREPEAAGDLDLNEAEKALDTLIRKAKVEPSTKRSS